MAQYTMDNCIFCKEFTKDKLVYENSLWLAVEDGFPVSKGHTLIIPKRHCETYFDLNKNELSSLSTFIKEVKSMLDFLYKPDAYNIGCNCGEASGQTVNHCHIHIIPRYNGDVDDPRGGVRGVIPSNQKY